MTSITIYKPGTKKHEVVVNIPSAWNELSKDELVFICKKLLEIEASGYAGKVKMLLFMIMHNAAIQKADLPKNWQQQLSAEDVAINGLDTINWIFDTADLTTQLLPVLHVSHGYKPAFKMYGPASSFDDITCGEFEDTEVFFNKYNDAKEPHSLVMITAILWRIKYNGKRQAYFGYDTERFVARWMEFPPEILQANFLWYIGCRQMLPLLFPSTFSKGDGPNDMAAFTKCIHAGAGPKNGTRDQIRKTLLKEFFLDMELEAQNMNDESK